MKQRLLIFGFLVTLAVGFPPIAVAQQEACPYSLTLTKNVFTRHEPILLKLVITNSSFEPLPVSLGYDREGAFLFTVRRPDGSVIELPRKKVREGLSRVGRFTVEPSKAYTQQLILNEWYAFPDVGVYEIAVSLVTRAGAERVCLDTRFNIEITALDTNQLQQACGELVEVIRRNDHDVGNVLDAAKALLVVKHPLVVPFLEEALQANHAISWLVIHGLEEIGNEQAVKVLIPMLANPDPQDSDFLQARGALLSIQKRTTDPATLELIKIALARVNN